MPEIPRRNFLHSMLAAAGWYRFTPRQQADMFALVLGTVQDGGLPQAGCYTPRCNAARQNPRFVASLALVNLTAERFYLVDATPDITRQIDLIPGQAFRQRAQARRPFDGIFLTHAHIGHRTLLVGDPRRILSSARQRQANRPCLYSPIRLFSGYYRPTRAISVRSSQLKSCRQGRSQR